MCRLLLLASALLASGCVSLAEVAAPVAAPEIRVGDAWTYNIYDGFRGYLKGSRLYEVVQVTADMIVVAVTEDNATVTRAFTKSWNPFTGTLPENRIVDFKPPYPAFRFPLEHGRRWTGIVNATAPGSDRSVPVQVQARVVGGERVSTPAGDFDAVRIERWIRIVEGEWWRSDINVVETEWYAPAVGRTVRFQTEQAYYIDQTRSPDGPFGLNQWVHLDRVWLELAGYTRNPPADRRAALMEMKAGPVSTD